MRCRLCIYEFGINNTVRLFDKDGESYFNKLITKYIGLEINEDDSCSTMICESCAKHLNEFDEFFLLIEYRQTELQNEFLEVRCNSNKDLDLQAITEITQNIYDNEESYLDTKDVLVEETMHPSAIAQEEFGFAENSENDSNSEFDNMSENIKINTSDEEGNENVSLPKLVKTTKAKRSKRIKTLMKTKKKGRPKKNTKTTTVDEDINNENSEKIKSNKEQYSSEENRLKDELIEKHLRLKCEVCNTPVDSMNDLRIHFRQLHKMKAYIVCCGKHFKRRFVLLDHLKVHLNPEHFKCEICNKVLNSRASLRNHHANLHSDALDRKHICTVCGRRFGLCSNLNAHMVTHKEIRDYICQICNKGFKTNNLLKQHIISVHENVKPFVCEICGQDYKFKPAFDLHVAEHNGIPNQLTEQCTICKKWFRPNGLRFHMARHDVKDVKCSHCGKILKSKSALKAHIRYWHKNLKIYKCTYCDREFKKPCVLREHIAMHTGQKDYNCPHCPREFRSKANMYAHIKKIHFEEWEQAQLIRNRGPVVEKKEIVK